MPRALRECELTESEKEKTLSGFPRKRLCFSKREGARVQWKGNGKIYKTKKGEIWSKGNR